MGKRGKGNRDLYTDIGTWFEEGRIPSVEDIASDSDLEDRDVKYVVLVIYDIVENKQRRKVSTYLSGFGNRVQKSAFEARLNRRQYRRLLDGLEKLLKPEDNIRIYKLRGYEEIKTFGSKEYIEEEDVILI